MKNINSNSDALATEQQQQQYQTSYKPVVIIGNGPSALSLSFFLAGNLPYWKPEEILSHPDDLLKTRLKFSDSNKSLIESNLKELTNGLEGRSTNPVSLLFDSLNHPGADLGLDLPCMLDYRLHKERKVDHIVLGKHKPGGAWHNFDGKLRTLSLSEWMSLPGLSFSDWKRSFDRKQRHKSSESSECIKSETEKIKTRALISDVASYYEDYVKLMNLDKYFRSDTIVVKVRHVEENEKFNNSKFENARWIVHGYDKTARKPFQIFCNKVVLAVGSSDLTNRIGVRGENKSPSWIKYELPLLENAIEAIKEDEKSKPVMIVGSGLSAADAILECRKKDIEVIHVFRSVNGGFAALPPAFFPEYNTVYSMMRNAKTKHDCYQALPESTLKEIKTINGRHLVTIQNLRNPHECQTFDVSYLAIFIGTRPDLSLMQNVTSHVPKQLIVTTDENPSENIAIRTLRRLKIFCEKCRHMNLCFGISNRSIINTFIDEKSCHLHKCQHKNSRNDGGVGLGEDPNKTVDVKNNPLAVNKFTNELLNVDRGVYALGPLVGDNFVRFIPGGALAIASSILTEK